MSTSAGIGCCQILLWSGLVVRLLVPALGAENRCARRCRLGRLATAPGTAREEALVQVDQDQVLEQDHHQPQRRRDRGGP
jgi:hypothetical protein